MQLATEKTSITERLAGIGHGDGDRERLDAVELEVFGDLLENMLRYCPEERLMMSEVLSHPWFLFE